MNELECRNEDCENVFTWENEYTTIKRAVDLAKSTKGWKISSKFHECPSCLKEKKLSKLDLIYSRYYLIDEKKCLYKSIEDDGIYYREEGARMFSRQNSRSADDNSAWPGPPVAFTRSK